MLSIKRLERVNLVSSIQFVMNNTRLLISTEYPLGSIGHLTANTELKLVDADGNSTAYRYEKMTLGYLYLLLHPNRAWR